MKNIENIERGSRGKGKFNDIDPGTIAINSGNNQYFEYNKNLSESQWNTNNNKNINNNNYNPNQKDICKLNNSETRKSNENSLFNIKSIFKLN